MAASHCYRHALMRARLASASWLWLGDPRIAAVNNVSMYGSWLCFQELSAALSIQRSGSWNVGRRWDKGIESHWRWSEQESGSYAPQSDETWYLLYSDARQTINGDPPILSTNCKKPVVWWDWDWMSVLRVLDETKLGVCRCVPKCDSMLCWVCNEFPMLWESDARACHAVRNWPLWDCWPHGCFNLLDFVFRYDKEVVVEPEQTSVVPLDDYYIDVHEQAPIVAVPDLNRLKSGCCDPIALWRIPGCSHHIPWSSVCTHLRAAMSQMAAVPFFDAEMSRVALDEKLTPRKWWYFSQCEKPFSYVIVSKTHTSPSTVPAVICYARRTLVGRSGTKLSQGRYSRRDTTSLEQLEMSEV